MKLVRTATLTFWRLSDTWDRFHVESGDATLHSVLTKTGGSDERKTVLVVAEITLDALPEVSPDGLVAVPESARRELESLIEETASLIAVSCQTEHRVASATPAVALVPESDDDERYLDGCRGFAGGFSGRESAGQDIKLTPERVAGLQDRLDGVALLAEVYAHHRALGRYRELMRFFELAFARTSTDLSKKLYQFLSSDPFGYTHDEVRTWCSLRHGSMHGDLKKSGLVLESDVRPFVARMEQAALDVLFNKKEWREASRERRKLWVPVAGTTSASGGIMIVQGTESTLHFQMYDQFMAYPLNLTGFMTSTPDGWWCPQVSDTED